MELQEVDDADDTVYEYGLPEEEEGGFIGTLSNLVAPARREVIKAPEEKQVPLEELGMDAIPGETMTVKTPGEYGPVETDFSYAPIVRGAKSVLDYGKKLFSDEKTQEDTVQALKAAPAAAVEGGGKFLEDQMAAAMGMSAGYSSVNRPDGEVARFDPLAFTGAVAPAGIAATSTAKAGEVVLGIFGSSTGRTAAKRFEKYNDEVEKLEKSGRVHKKKDSKDTFLFRKSGGVFLDEGDIPRFEMSTKDVELLPYFKKRNAVAGEENTFKVNPDPQMKSDLMLPDVIKFDELFNEYPQLKNIKVIDMPEKEGYENTAAYYASDRKEIAVRANDEKQFISSLLHEIQHAVDDIELLPGGSNPDMFKGKSKSTEEFFEYLDQQSKYIKKRNAFKGKFKSAMSDRLTKQDKEILDNPEEMDKLLLNLTGIDGTHEYRSLNNITTGKMAQIFDNKYESLQSKIVDYINEQDNFKIIEPLFEDVQGFIYDKIKFDYANDQIKKRKYRQTPGEVDARNVSRRFLVPEYQRYLPSRTADVEKDFSVNKEIEKYMDAESRVLENVDTIKLEKFEPAKVAKINKTWWLDSDIVTLYHGTHKRNLKNVSGKGLKPDADGFVYLTPDPNTAAGYASMSASGGESAFRKSGKAVHTPEEDRIILKYEIPKKEFLKILDQNKQRRGPLNPNYDVDKDKLFNKDVFDKHMKNKAKVKDDYYAKTEVRFPENNPFDKYLTSFSNRKNALKKGGLMARR